MDSVQVKSLSRRLESPSGYGMTAIFLHCRIRWPTRSTSVETFNNFLWIFPACNRLESDLESDQVVMLLLLCAMIKFPVHLALPLVNTPSRPIV